MIRCGVDLVEIERIEATIARSGDRFLNRIFTPAEQAQCDGRVHSLSGRFAVKEAVAKALGTGIGDMNWTDIEILQDERGRPHLHLHNRARAIAHEAGPHRMVGFAFPYDRACDRYGDRRWKY